MAIREFVAVLVLYAAAIAFLALLLVWSFPTQV